MGKSRAEEAVEVRLIPLADGRRAACRTSRLRAGTRRDTFAALTPWIGAGFPDLANPLLQQMMRLTHHDLDSGTGTGWMFAPPLEVWRIGLLPGEPPEEATE